MRLLQLVRLPQIVRLPQTVRLPHLLRLPQLVKLPQIVRLPNLMEHPYLVWQPWFILASLHLVVITGVPHSCLHGSAGMPAVPVTFSMSGIMLPSLSTM
jgi:hypothetical protein